MRSGYRRMNGITQSYSVSTGIRLSIAHNSSGQGVYALSETQGYLYRLNLFVEKHTVYMYAPTSAKENILQRRSKLKC